MKLTLLFCALLLSTQAWCASGMAATTAPAVPSVAPAAQSMAPAVQTTAPATGNYSLVGKDPFFHSLLKKPLRGKPIYYKGKGTMGLILGLTLGPVGWGAIHLLSHNQTQRDKAKTGMFIWIGVVCAGAIVWGCIATKVSLDDFLYFFLQAAAYS